MLNSPRITRVNIEIANRRKEALRVYRPMSHVLPFHLSPAVERVLRGGKRSGKTVGAAMEFSSIVTGTPLTGPDGNPLPFNHRISTPTDPLRYWVIGYDSRHIGETLYHKLFSPGLFRIIPDETTGEWRPFNEADPRDMARHAESEPVGPAIPERMIKPDSWVWENKAENYFKSVELINGVTIYAYISSSPIPKQGDAVAGIWIDEDIKFASHLKEYQDRLTTQNGWLMWSAWPHGANPALIGLLQRAQDEVTERAELKKQFPDQELPSLKIESFKLKMTDNEYIGKAGKENSLARMGSDEQIARRNEGELLMDRLVMYDYMPAIHVVKPIEHKERPTESKEIIESLLHKRGELPLTWSRYLSIDPSHQRTAIHVGTVPPPEWEGHFFGNLLIVERELVLRRLLAKEIAAAVREMLGHWRLEAMIMDQNAGRQTHAGREDSTAEFFASEFAAAGIEANIGKSTFIPGCNEPARRYSTVRSLMRVNSLGCPSLLFVDEKTPYTLREFISYVKKVQKNEGLDEDEQQILDEPANPRVHDCMASLEYLATYVAERFAAGDAYVPMAAFRNPGSAAYQFFMKNVKPQQDQPYTHLGPGPKAA